MNSISRFVLSIAVIFAVGNIQSLIAADTPLNFIPTQTGLLVRCKNPVAIAEKLAPIADRLQATIQKHLTQEDQSEENWGESIRAAVKDEGIFADDGVDQDRDLWLLFSNPLTAWHSYVYFIPAKDTQAVQEAVTRNLAKAREAGKDEKQESHDEPTEFFVHEGWVIHGAPAEITAIKQRIAGELEPIETRFDDECRTMLYSGDLGVFVDLKHLSGLAGVAVGVGQQFLAAPFLGITISNPEIEDTKSNHQASMNMLNEVTEAISQAIFDLDHLVVSITIEADEIRLDHRLAVRQDSPIGKIFADNPGSAMEVLSALPGVNAVYLGLNLNWKSMAAWSAKKYRQTKMDREIRHAWEEIFNGYQDLNIGSIVTAYPMRPIEQGLLRSESIAEVDNPLAYRELMLKSNELSSDKIMQKADVIERSTEQYGEYAVDVVRFRPSIRFEGNANLGDEIFGGSFSRLENVLLGPDGNVQRTIYLKDRVVNFSGGAKLRAVAAVRRAAQPETGSVVLEPHVARMREKLHSPANVIVMVDPGQIAAAGMLAWNAYLDFCKEMARKEFGNNQNAEAKPEDGLVPEEPGRPIKQTVQKPNLEGDSNDEENTDNADEEMEQKPIGVEMNAEAELEDALNRKFTEADFEALYEQPSVIGFSLSLKENCCRYRNVIPIDAICQLAKAGAIALDRVAVPVETIETSDEMVPERDSSVE